MVRRMPMSLTAACCRQSSQFTVFPDRLRRKPRTIAEAHGPPAITSKLAPRIPESRGMHAPVTGRARNRHPKRVPPCRNPQAPGQSPLRAALILTQSSRFPSRSLTSRLEKREPPATRLAVQNGAGLQLPGLSACLGARPRTTYLEGEREGRSANWEAGCCHRVARCAGGVRGPVDGAHAPRRAPHPHR